jgi:serine/alanine adding enzyme
MALTVCLETEPTPEWDAYVEGHRHATNYHRYGWKVVIESSFGHRGYFLAARDERRAIRGVLPLVHMKSALFGSFLVSMPFFNYGGLICDEPGAEELLLEEAKTLRRTLGARHVELRHLDRQMPGLATRSHKVGMVLDLETDEEAEWRRLDPKVRNQVRKAQKHGLQAVSGHLDLLDGFYGVFCRNMRDLGTPVYGKGFFRRVLQSFPDSTRIVSVLLDGIPVASALLTWFRGTVEVPWASSVRDHNDKCPNNLLYWEAIRFAIGAGADRFDFGRSTPGGGTFRFKKQWGARPVPLHWQYLLQEGRAIPELNPANPRYDLAIRLWRQLPVRVTNLLGPAIVRSIP